MSIEEEVIPHLNGISSLKEDEVYSFAYRSPTKVSSLTAGLREKYKDESRTMVMSELSTIVALVEAHVINDGDLTKDLISVIRASQKGFEIMATHYQTDAEEIRALYKRLTDKINGGGKSLFSMLPNIITSIIPSMAIQERHAPPPTVEKGDDDKKPTPITGTSTSQKEHHGYSRSWQVYLI